MSILKREDIRNIAIIAHVDHGKTTLVDAMLKATNTIKGNDVQELIMDSLDLERERGITIKAKNASLFYNGIKINFVDTPGHADFGGEVERILRMVDGVLLLVDAKEGPMPQTRFVLKKALSLGLSPIVVINKIDRHDARINDVLNEIFELFIELGATEQQLDFPIIYASGIKGVAYLDLKEPQKDLFQLFETIIKYIPGPTINSENSLQMLIMALDYDNYKGKLGIGRIYSGIIKRGDTVALINPQGRLLKSKISAIFVFKGLQREEIAEAKAGEIVAIAGFDNISIGDTITSLENPKALDPISIDEPTVQMEFAVNTSPFAGQEGKYVTSRHLRERLFKEIETNISLRVKETNKPDSFLVFGRGELHLAILIETMRREGYEFQVSQPEVIIREINGIKCEPYEFLTIDVSESYQGAVIESVGSRAGVLQNMISTRNGEIHFEFIIPTRGIFGLKNILITATKGNVSMHHVFHDYQPLSLININKDSSGSLISWETGKSSAYGLSKAQERGILFITPGTKVYEGMIVGKSPKNEDINVNVCRVKNLTNFRATATDQTIYLNPIQKLIIEYALEYIGPDELIEFTPQNIRLRKKILDKNKRKDLLKKETA